MKKIYSLSLVALIPLVNLCKSEEADLAPSKLSKGLILKTIDGFGKPVKSSIVYESRDCEYDFVTPETANSNNNGITYLKVDPGYLQLYAEGFLHESYRCLVYSDDMDTLTIYGSKIPTFIETGIAHSSITYFSNVSGDCEYEEAAMGTTLKSDALGKAIIYLPAGDTYKIQANGMVQCFQPDQEIHTLRF